MLAELGEMQESDESVYSISMSFEVETRSEDAGELVHRQYRFGYAKEWDKWVFHEFSERRTAETEGVANRSWHEARNISWDDGEPPVEIPTEVSEKLKQATGADTIIIQTPSGGMREND